MADPATPTDSSSDQKASPEVRRIRANIKATIKADIKPQSGVQSTSSSVEFAPDGTPNLSTSTPIEEGMQASSTPVGEPGLPASSTEGGGQAASFQPTGDSVYDSSGTNASATPGSSHAAEQTATGRRAARPSSGGTAGDSVSTPTSDIDNQGQILASEESTPSGNDEQPSDDAEPDENETDEGSDDEEGGDSNSLAEQENLAPAENKPVYDEPTGIAPSTPPGQAKKPPSREDLQDAEENAGEKDKDEDKEPEGEHENQVGRGYQQAKDQSSGVIGFLTKKRSRRTYAIYSAILSLVISGIIFLFSLLPLKVISIMTNIQSHFGATSQAAIQKETDNLMSGYLKKYVLPGLKHCGGGAFNKSTIDRTCSPLPVGDTSIVGNLYKSWRTARVENTLAEKYGTEFRYNAKSGRYYIKSRYLTQDADITNFATKDSITLITDAEGYTEVSGPELAKFIRGFNQNMEDLTRFQELTWRFKTNLLLAKYGGWARHIFPDQRNAVKASIQNKKKAATIKIAQRVVTPLSEQYSVVLQCVMIGCSTDLNGDPGINGQPRSKTEVQLQEKLASIAAQDGGTETLDAISKAVSDINEKGWGKYMIGKAFSQVVFSASGSQEAADKASSLSEDALGPVGWVLMSSQLINGLNKAGPVVDQLGYAMKAAAYASMFITYRTYADEVKSGNVDATEVGSFTDSLGPGSQCSDGSNLNKDGKCANGDTQLGGTASAEQSPVYNSIVNGSTSTSSIASLFSSASAASNSPSDICGNGKPIPAGQSVCSEERLDSGSGILDSIHSLLTSPEFAPITKLAGYINDASFYLLKPLGYLAQGLSWLLEHTPGVSYLWNEMTSAIKGIVSPVFSKVVTTLIPNPISTSMSGARKLEAIAGGGDVFMNDFSHNELGGVELTNQQVADARASQTTQDLQNFTSQPLLSRLFNRNSQYSLVSRLALSVPSDKANAMENVASIFSNPFGKIGHALANIFSFKALAASDTAQADPFGITQYGYPADDPIFSTDAETYYQQHCADSHMTDAWNTAAAATSSQDNNYQADNPQQPVNGLSDGDPKGTDPCLLIQATVGSAGGLFNPSLLGGDAGSQ